MRRRRRRSIRGCKKTTYLSVRLDVHVPMDGGVAHDRLLLQLLLDLELEALLDELGAVVLHHLLRLVLGQLVMM